jgi:hypothetical protein
MKNRLQVIPLDLLIDPPPEPQQARTPRLRTLAGRVGWGWCLAFAMVQFLVGCIMLLNSVNPYGISYFLALAGFSSTLSLCFPEVRAHPIACLLTTYGVLSVLGSVVGFPTSFP